MSTRRSEGDFVSWGWFEQDDLSAALSYLAIRSEVDASRIGALGFSRGGAVVIEVAARDSRIRSMVVAAATTSLREGLEVDFGRLAILPATVVFASYGVDINSVRPIDRICEIAPRHVLIIHGSADPATPVEMGRRLGKAACSNSEYWELPGARHGEFADAAADYGKRLVRFFQASLLAP